MYDRNQEFYNDLLFTTNKKKVLTISAFNMDSMILERISSIHETVMYNNLTYNKTALVYQIRTIAWMLKRENLCNYMSEECWRWFSGGVLADVLDEDRTFAMLSCVMINKAPEILYCKKVLFDDRCLKQKSTAPIPPTATSITFKVTPSWTFKSLTSNSSRHMVERLSKLLYFKPGMTENSIACQCKGKTKNSQLVTCQMCKQTQHYDCVEFLNKTWYNDTHYLCPRCWTVNDQVPCKATLIVVPDSCLEFWIQTIQTTFASDLKHFVYTYGMACNYIQPISFNKFDIVLTSYSTLKKDFRYRKYDVNQASISLQYHENNPYLRSPLLCLNWWRICLDQPQSFNSNTEKVYEMVSCLKSVHKWVMPGASIQESSKNIFNIMKYFNITECNDYKEFLQYMNDQINSSYSSLSKWIWCSLIKNINAELCLPKPIHEIHNLKFSKIEIYFYKRTAKLCMSKARSFYTFNRSISWLSKNIKEVDQETKTVAVGPINELFEACVVPLPTCATNESFTDLDSEFEFEKLKSSILKCHADNIVQDNRILKTKLAITTDFYGENSLCCNISWWVDMLTCISSPTGFIAEVKEIINKNCEPGTPNIVNSVKSLREISKILSKWQKSVIKSRVDVLNTYKTLKEISNDFSELKNICKTTLEEANENKCLIRQFRDQLNNYKQFVINNNIEIGDENIIKNLIHKNQEKAISQYEIILKNLILCKTYNSVTDNYKRIATEKMDILKILSSEFLIMWKLWLNLNKYKEVQKKIIKNKSAFRVCYKHHNPKFKLDGNKNSSDAKRRRTGTTPLNSFEFLKSLEHAINRLKSSHEKLSSLQTLKKSHTIMDMCYACASNQLTEYAILCCGHSLCSDCLIKACDSSDFIELTCPLCYISNPIKYIERLTCNQGSDKSLNGSYCTKVESIVFKLLEVTALDKSIKIIIISSFEKSLDCLSLALELNKINFMRLDLETKNITTVLNTFQNSENITAILINSNIGLTNKLNFASMVFFMEPLMDKSLEEQIIDLVCYKKKEQTYVHHFILKDSIEEVILNKFYDDDNPINNVTLGQLATIL